MKIRQPDTEVTLQNHDFSGPQRRAPGQDVEVLASRAAQPDYAAHFPIQDLLQRPELPVELDLELDRHVGQVCDFFNWRQHRRWQGLRRPRDWMMQVHGRNRCFRVFKRLGRGREYEILA